MVTVEIKVNGKLVRVVEIVRKSEFRGETAWHTYSGKLQDVENDVLVRFIPDCARHRYDSGLMQLVRLTIEELLAP